MKLALPKLLKAGSWSERLRRMLALGVLGLIVTGASVFAVKDVAVRLAEARQDRGELIRDLSSVANMLFLSEENHVNGLVERLRVELRAQGLWSRSQIVDALGITGDGRNEIDARRLHGILRRGLSANDDVSALELVVAGHEGLSTFRLERGSTSEEREVLDPRVQEGFAKALWYADEVRRSVISAGRRVERGDLSFEKIGDAEHPILRVAIGLHDPGELVQGAVVVSVDVGAFAARLETISAGNAEIALLMPDGRGLTSPAVVSEIDGRNTALAARVLGAAELPEVFEADGRLIYGLPMARADGSRANLLVLVETEAPPKGLNAWLETSWPVALSMLGLVSGLVVWSLFRGPRLHGADLEGRGLSRNADSERKEAAAGAASIEVSRESFVMREWLSDVRGCLERDAATRGLALDMRCDRGLPDELECDSGWLGGLLVAMGREAFDATSGERIQLDVVEDVGETLRFEWVAQGVTFGAIGGMEEVAGKIGGRFESGQEGRTALVLENALVSA